MVTRRYNIIVFGLDRVTPSSDIFLHLWSFVRSDPPLESPITVVSLCQGLGERDFVVLCGNWED